MEMKRNSGLTSGSLEPLYKQLYEILKDEIKALPENAKFSSERQLCARFKVSQPVVRRALSMLEYEGYIVRISSQGTFVRKQTGGLSSARTMKIGVFAPLSVPYKHIVESIKGINEVAGENNLEILFIEDEHPDIIDLSQMAARAREHIDIVDGIIWVSGVTAEIDLLPRVFTETPSRHVFINLIISDGKFTCVVADYASAEYSLTKKIISLGYNNIGYIGGPEDRLSGRLRYEGFLRAMKESGLEINPACVYSYSPDSVYNTGYEAVNKMIKGGIMPQIIIAWNDFMASGAISALKEHAYRVPEDIGVAGFDDIDIAVQMKPTLTTVAQPSYELGKTAARFIVDQINGRINPGNICYTPCPIVIRESCEEKIGESARGVGAASGLSV